MNPAPYVAHVADPPGTSGVRFATNVCPDIALPEHVMEILDGLIGAPLFPVIVAGAEIVMLPLPVSGVVCMVPVTVSALLPSGDRYRSVVPALLHVTGDVPDDSEMFAIPSAKH